MQNITTNFGSTLANSVATPLASKLESPLANGAKLGWQALPNRVATNNTQYGLTQRQTTGQGLPPLTRAGVPPPAPRLPFE